MKYTLQHILTWLILFPVISLQGQAFDWAKGQPGIGVDVCMDNFHNTFTCSQIVGSAIIGSNTLNSFGVQDVVVVKHDPQGNTLWATQLGGTQSDYSREVAYDNSGNVWVIGQFSGTMQAGSFTLTSAGGTDGFIAKLNASTGAVLFAERYGSTGNDDGIAIKANAAGEIFIAGTYVGNFSYGMVNLTGQGQWDVFMVKLNNAGSPLWGEKISGTGIETMWTMNIDNANNIYIGGFCTSASTNFAGTQITIPANSHYIAKFDNSGACLWATLSEFNGEIYGLSIDGAGSVYFTGNFDTQASFGPINITNSGPNDDILLIKINSAGAYCWAKFYGSTGSDQGYDLKCNAAGDLFLTGSYQASFSFGNTVVNAGGSSQSYTAKFDSSGTEQWVMTAIGSNTNYSNAIAINTQGDVYMSGIAGSNITFGNQTVTMPNGSGYLAKMADNANIIQGTVFRDINNDGILNTGETGVPNSIVRLNNGPYVTNSNNSGIYNMYAAAGTFSVSIPNLPLYHTLSTPAVLTSTFTGLGNSDTAKHFGLYPVPNVNDLWVDITPITNPKAGFVLSYMVTYKNLGTTTQNGNVQVIASPVINYLQASPAPTTQNGQTIQWNVGSLAPQSMGTIHVSFNIPTNLNIGDTIRSFAEISPVSNDTTPLNNVKSSTRLVVGPYDPNYKEVDITTVYNVTTSEWLEYIVHFQNIGNDSAHTVYILDSLTPYLDWSTLEILATSHNPMQLSMNASGIAEFRFPGIMLPDSTTDPIGSCGFVKYRIKYLATFPLYDSITNYADIYFDYNPPITTNTIATYHLTPVSRDQDLNATGILLYPNPAGTEVHIRLVEHNGSDIQIQLLDLSGKTLYESQTRGISSTLDVSLYPAGIYIVNVQDGTRHFRQLLMINR
jgi:hypothetical protein